MSLPTLSSARPTVSQPLPYCLPSEVVLVSVPDGTARLLDLQGQSFALTEVAARMLQATLELGPAEAARGLALHYGVEVERLRTDLENFVSELLRQGLLVPVGQPLRPPRLRERLARFVVSVLVRLMRLRPSLSGKVAGLLSIANLSFRWLAWAQTVRLWQRLFPPPSRLLEGAAAEETRQAIDQAVRRGVAHSALRHACKERGLTAWCLGRSAGLAPRLVLGVSLCPIHAHCWAQLGTSLLGDDPDQIVEFQPVRSYE